MKGESKVTRLIRIMRDLETMHLDNDAALDRNALLVRFHSLLGLIAYDEVTLAEAAPSAELMRGVEAFVEAVEANAVAKGAACA